MVGVTKRRNEAWLTRWLKSPEKMLETDPEAKAMLKEYNNLPMPNQSLSDAEVRQYIRYFNWIDAQPAGSLSAGEPVTDAAPRLLHNRLGRPSDD